MGNGSKITHKVEQQARAHFTTVSGPMAEALGNERSGLGEVLRHQEETQTNSNIKVQGLVKHSWEKVQRDPQNIIHQDTKSQKDFFKALRSGKANASAPLESTSNSDLNSDLESVIDSKSKSIAHISHSSQAQKEVVSSNHSMTSAQKGTIPIPSHTRTLATPESNPQSIKESKSEKRKKGKGKKRRKKLKPLRKTLINPTFKTNKPTSPTLPDFTPSDFTTLPSSTPPSSTPPSSSSSVSSSSSSTPTPSIQSTATEMVGSAPPADNEFIQIYYKKEYDQLYVRYQSLQAEYKQLKGKYKQTQDTLQQTQEEQKVEKPKLPPVLRQIKLDPTPYIHQLLTEYGLEGREAIEVLIELLEHPARGKELLYTLQHHQLSDVLKGFELCCDHPVCEQVAMKRAQLDCITVVEHLCSVCQGSEARRWYQRLLSSAEDLQYVLC